MSSKLPLLAVASLLAGCFGNSLYKIPLGYAPDHHQGLPGAAAKTFNIEVKDLRPYVTHGNKVPYYLGHYRGGYGNPIDVVNPGKVALAGQIKSDMRKEFESLGMAESASGASRKVVVRIRDWNFDGAVNIRFWYEVELTLMDSDGKQLASSHAKDEKIIETNPFGKPHTQVKKEIVAYYGEMIRKLVREDPAIVAAL